MRQSSVALHGVFTMSAAHSVKGLVAICATVFLFSASPAHSQEVQHLPTIADCPRGYVLGVQDTEDPQPVATLPLNPNDYTIANQDKNAAEAAARQASAPRQFITGCFLPQQQQQNR